MKYTDFFFRKLKINSPLSHEKFYGSHPPSQEIFLCRYFVFIFQNTFVHGFYGKLDTMMLLFRDIFKYFKNVTVIYFQCLVNSFPLDQIYGCHRS